MVFHGAQSALVPALKQMDFTLHLQGMLGKGVNGH